MIKVLVCDPISNDGIKMLEDAGFSVDIKTGLDQDALCKVIESYDVMIVRSATKVTSNVINCAKNLKLVVRGGVGIDNIDVQACESKNIGVMNTPEASTNSVAELTIGLMLSLSRFISQADASMKQRKWEKKRFVGYELSGKTLGIVGLGRIGQAVAQKAMALGMNVIAYNRSPKNYNNVQLVSLDVLLKEAHYVSFHVSYQKGSKPLIGVDEFKKMRPGIFIINVARGGVIDEGALLQALNDNIVAGVALDVWAQEPTINYDLSTHPRVIALPHIAASTSEAQSRVGMAAANVIIKFFKN